MLQNGKARINDSVSGLSITIPSKKNWFALVFGTVWLGGWAIGFKFASSTLFSDTAGPASAFLAFWLMGWTLGGLGVLTLLAWGYFGQEKFLLDRGDVILEKSVFGLGIKRRLNADELKNVRTETGNSDWFGRNRLAFWGLGAGKIKFDYGLKSYSFGLGVDDAEATYIASLMKEHFKEAVPSSLRSLA